MAKSNPNSGKTWTPQDIKTLKQLVKENTPTRLMGRELGRTEDAIYSKASDLGISIKPVNQSPYNRQQKSK